MGRRKRPATVNRDRRGMNLAYHTVKKRKRKKRTRRSLKTTVLVGAVILIVLGGSTLFMTPAAANVYYSSMSARDQLMEAQKAIEDQNIGRAVSQIRLASQNFQSAQKSMRVLTPLRIIPYVGRQVKATRQLVLAGVEITAGLEEALGTMEVIIVPLGENEAASFDKITAEQRQEVLKNLFESTPRLERATTHLELAEIHLDDAPESALLEPLRDAMEQIQEQLPGLKSMMETVTIASRIVPGLAGYPEEQEFFLLFQNNSELRPSGGFIGSYGVMKTKDGEISDLVTTDSYHLDDVTDITISPPWQIDRLLAPGIRTWYFRDSNWSPDFPTAAENALWFYQEEGGEGDFAGVVSFTPTFLEKMLTIVGPIELPGRGEAFTDENITSRIQYESNVGFEDLKTRKSIIGELGQKIMEKIFTLDREQWIPFSEAVRDGFAEKQLMIYLRDEEAQAIIEDNGWSSHVNRDAQNDYVMYVDSNMASLKTDLFVQREGSYSVDFSNPRPRATYTIKYTNVSPGFSFKTTRYRSWARLYTPEGSELVSIEGQDTAPDYYPDGSEPFEVVQEEDLGKVSFGTFIVTEINETREVTFTYDLPESIGDAARNGEYDLVLQKQPGIVSTNMTVDFENMPGEKTLLGEGYYIDPEDPESARTVEMRRDYIWAMPDSSQEPSAPPASLIDAL